MAEWKSAGHLFLALERCGCSAFWLLAQLKADSYRRTFEATYLATKSHSKDSADDMEIALFFDLYPDRRPMLLEAIKTVGDLWTKTRVLTLRLLLKRQSEPGGEAIRARLEQCKADRLVAAEDVAAGLWLTSPALAAGIAARQSSRNVIPATSFLIRSQEDARKALTEGLMDGLEDA